jgi:hypothetical protein
MESKQITDSILETVRKEVNEFVETQSEIKSSLEYELRVWEVAKVMAREMIRQSSGAVPKSRNSKKKS